MAERRKAGLKGRAFDYDLDYDAIDFRKHPERYTIGKGEQGVLMIEPYKSEILPHWRFRTPAIAQESSQAIYAMFLDYKEKSDFPGMDMARKFLQMGYTRARRYANHRSGRKYAKEGGAELPRDIDEEKAESAAVFKAVWERAKRDPDYVRMKEEHIRTHEQDGRG
ncbi:DUF4385 domain-containing protein [Paenibacillus albicereus]|uniref:DUF4385 domain-containing protein n=1 Tax=Paenibacillus albicereus TaxID=2726185 RepID=A0A6H2GU24_9BACL|nr:DUF4385 domain-containing protein [Paenibacillus albicereus]QJC50921.1 DUF4385 domain-containing protein [Paenibacillus albicereus]